MRLASSALLFVTLAVAPAFCQNVQTNVASSAAVSTLPTDTAASTPNPSGDFQSLREDLAHQNKAMTDQANIQKAILKKNQDLLKEAQKINAANLKIAEEQKKVAAANAELDKQREALKASQKPVEIASK